MKIKTKKSYIVSRSFQIEISPFAFKKKFPSYFSLLVEKMNIDLCSRFSDLNETSRFFNRLENMKLNSPMSHLLLQFSIIYT